MCLFLYRRDFGNSYVCQLPIRKWQIFRYCEILTRLHLVEQDFYWVFDNIRPLHFSFIPHYVYGRDLDVSNVEPVHKLHKRLVCIPHHHIFCSLDSLVVYGYDDNFIDGAVRAFD